MTNRTGDHDHQRLERSLRVWLTEGRPPLADRDAQIGAVLQALDHAPQSRARFLGRWFDRARGIRRGADAHEHSPNENRSNRLILSATGVMAALAILALAVNVVDREPVPPASGGGAIHAVAADGSGDYTSIQDAVDAAADGDTITIQPGEYLESVMVGKDLTILGEGSDPSEVTVRIPDDGPVDTSLSMTLRYAFWFDDVTAEIANMTIEGPGQRVSALVAVDGDLTAHRLIEDLDPYVRWPYGFLYIGGDATGMVHDNTAKAFVWIDDEARPTLRGNTIHNVVLARGASSPTITENSVGGVWASGAAVPLIKSNDIDYANNGGSDRNKSSCGIQANDRAVRPSITGNTITNAPIGVCLGPVDAVTVSGNQLVDNRIAVSLSRSNATIEGNRITGDGAGVIVLNEGTPSITDNVIDVTGRGIVAGDRTSPVIDGNEVCGGDESILVNAGATPSLGDNRLCSSS